MPQKIIDTRAEIFYEPGASVVVTKGPVSSSFDPVSGELAMGIGPADQEARTVVQDRGGKNIYPTGIANGGEEPVSVAPQGAEIKRVSIK